MTSLINLCLLLVMAVVERSDGAGVYGLTNTWRQAGVGGGTGPFSKAQEGFVVLLANPGF